MSRVLTLVLLVAGVIFLLWFFGRVEAPLEHEFSLVGGETFVATVVGKVDGNIYVETDGEGTRRKLEPHQFGLVDKFLSLRLEERNPPAIRLPVRRKLTNLAGNSFAGTILSHQNGQILVTRDGDEKQFVVSVSDLSREDRAFLEELAPPDAEEVALMEAAIIPAGPESGRSAVWHRDLGNAMREAERENLPVVLVFLASSEPKSIELDETILRTPAFRDWANSKAVLCVYYNNPEKQSETSGLDGAGAREARDLAKRFKVNRPPATVILGSDGSQLGKFTRFDGIGPGAYIARLEEAIE